MATSPSPVEHQTHCHALWEVDRPLSSQKGWNAGQTGPGPRSPRFPLQLSYRRGLELLQELRALQFDKVVFTGVDPDQFCELEVLVGQAATLGLRPALALPRLSLTRSALEQLRVAGLAEVELRLDAPTASRHNAITGQSASFRLTIAAARMAKRLGLALHIQSLVNSETLPCLRETARLAEKLGAEVWSAVYQVPLTAVEACSMLSANIVEESFAVLAELARDCRFELRTRYARHFRRYELQQGVGHKNPEVLPWRNGQPWREPVDSGPSLYVSHTGEVFADPMLPISAGNINFLPLARIYQGSGLFAILHNRTMLKGKCGICEFRELCGGSRARAYALTGDWMEADPACSYEPKRTRPLMREHLPAGDGSSRDLRV